MSPLKPNDPPSGSSMASNSSTNAGHSITRDAFVAPENSFDAKAKQASSAWQTLEAALKDVSEHSYVFSNIAEAKDQYDATQVMLQERDKRIAELKSASDFQLEQYGIQHTKWDKEKSQMEQKWSHERSQLEQRVVDLKIKMSTSAQETLKTEKAAHTKEVTALRKQLDFEKKNAIALNEDLKKAKTKIQRVEEDLLSCTKKLGKWEQYLSELKDLDYNRVNADVNKIFNRCLTIARTHFLRELPTELLTDSRWDDLTKSLNIPDLDFPPSNSEAAKHVRMAACMHILARRLCDDFFKRCYIPEAPMFAHVIQLILAKQFLSGADKERITRALLLSMYKPKQVDEAISQTVTKASEEVVELLSSIGGTEAFRKDVQSLFGEAVKVWRDVQHGREAVVVSMTDDFNDGRNWAYLEEFDAVKMNGGPGVPKLEMINLFPCIFVPEGEHLINPGYVLWLDQNTVVAAEQEFRQLAARFKGGSQRRDRRLSARSDGREGPAGFSPTSLKSEDKAPLSGSQRGSKQGNQTPNGNRGDR